MPCNQRLDLPVLSCALCALCVLFAGVRPASADITIIKENGDEASPAQATKVQDLLTGEWEITLTALYNPGGWTLYEIHGNAGETISNLVIDVPCWTDSNGDCIPAGSPVVVRVISDDPGGVTTVRNIIQTGTAETLLNLVDVREDLGRVEVEVIGHLYVGRDALGPVISTTKDNPSRGIGAMFVGRDVLGDVTAELGRVGWVLPEGRLGSPGSPVRIRAKHGMMRADGPAGAWAHINARANGGSGKIFRIRAPVFVGSIEIQSLRDNPENDRKGWILIDTLFDGNITIGDSFEDPDRYIELPANGLTGRIIFNADDHPDGTWSAPVHLGPEGSLDRITLDGPGYAIDAELLGGGSVGLVPYSVHLIACDPPSGSTIASPAVVELRHYGPVTLAGGAPLSITRRPLGTSEPFEEAPLAEFSISVSTDDANTILVAQAPGQDGFAPGYEYRVTATSQLRCDVAAQPPVAWQTAYTVAVEHAASCDSDLDADGTVDFDDLLAMLLSWGKCGSCPGDLDGNGEVGIGDLIRLLFDWGPC